MMKAWKIPETALHEVEPIRAIVSHKISLFISPADINVYKNWQYILRQKAQPLTQYQKTLLQEVWMMSPQYRNTMHPYYRSGLSRSEQAAEVVLLHDTTWSANCSRSTALKYSWVIYQHAAADTLRRPPAWGRRWRFRARWTNGIQTLHTFQAQIYWILWKGR